MSRPRLTPAPICELCQARHVGSVPISLVRALPYSDLGPVGCLTLVDHDTKVAGPVELTRVTWVAGRRARGHARFLHLESSNGCEHCHGTWVDYGNTLDGKQMVDIL